MKSRHRRKPSKTKPCPDLKQKEANQSNGNSKLLKIFLPFDQSLDQLGEHPGGISVGQVYVEGQNPPPRVESLEHSRLALVIRPAILCEHHFVLPDRVRWMMQSDFLPTRRFVEVETIVDVTEDTPF